MKKNKNTLYIALFIVGLLLMAYSFLPIFNATKTNRISGIYNKNIPATIIASSTEYTQKGKIWLTLTPKESLNKHIEGYYFNSKTAELVSTEHNPYTYSSFHSTSRNNMWRTFIGKGQSTESANTSVYRVHSSISTSSISNADKLTNNTYTAKRLPNINNNGDVIYMYLCPGTTALADTLNAFGAWCTTLIPSKTSSIKTTIKESLYPKWVSDTDFVYASHDGIYRYSRTSATSTRILVFDFPTYTNMKMSISKNGSLLAWSRPDTGDVLIYAITKTTKDSARLITSIKNVHAFWSAFSPDNRFLAIQVVDWKTITTNPNPRIEIYSLETGYKVYAFSVNDFIQTSLFLTDWTE